MIYTVYTNLTTHLLSLINTFVFLTFYSLFDFCTRLYLSLSDFLLTLLLSFLFTWLSYSSSRFLCSLLVFFISHSFLIFYSAFVFAHCFLCPLSHFLFLPLLTLIAFFTLSLSLSVCTHLLTFFTLTLFSFTHLLACLYSLQGF